MIKVWFGTGETRRPGQRQAKTKRISQWWNWAEGSGSPTEAATGRGAMMLLIEQRGRNLRAGQADRWMCTWFHDQGLQQLMGTIRYPKAA